ncbi:MAG: hypothetical protein JWN90_516 [Parcubacteria group bacterium]|nr:hypothetical protein [Parcubacteria group bacterium]
MTRHTLLALSLFVLVPSVSYAQDEKATQDPVNGTISVSGSTRVLPVTLTSRAPIGAIDQKKFQAAAERCAELYARIIDYRMYPEQIAFCVRRRMHLDADSVLQIVTKPR